MKKNTLVGRYFHTFKLNDKGEKILQCQGRIEANPEPSWYVVVYFDFLIGDYCYEELVKIEDMKEWFLYDTAEWWKNSYAHGPARNYRFDVVEERKLAEAELKK